MALLETRLFGKCFSCVRQIATRDAICTRIFFMPYGGLKDGGGDDNEGNKDK